MESKDKGSFEGWNEVWKSENDKAQINPYFDRGEPKTINSFWQQGYARDLLNLIKDKGYTKFCELGSGRGTTSMYLSDAGYEDITMVDLADQGFEVAKISFPHYNLKAPKMVLANVENTGLDSESFDCIYNIGLLEHFEDPSLTLKEAYRLLKPGGMIFMPIVPTMPLRKTYLLRLFFNPISLVKIMLKPLFKGKTQESSNILRTNYNEIFYKDICIKLGFSGIRCIPYNPYFLVNSNFAFSNNVVLPLYKSYYKLFKYKGEIAFETPKPFCSCYLLIAYK